MIKLRILNIALITIGLLLVTSGLRAQEDADSLMKLANKFIYKNPDETIRLGLEVYQIPGVRANTKLNALLAISTAYSSKRDYLSAQEYVNKIEVLLPKITDEIQVMNILNRIGAQYHHVKIYDKSIEYLDMSLARIEKYPIQDSIQQLLGYNYTIRGFVYREQMNCDIALKYFEKAISAYKKTLYKPIMNANLSVCYYNVGNCLLSKNQIQDARDNFLKAIDFAEKVDAQSLIAFAKKGLAEVETVEGDYHQAVLTLQNGLKISDSVGDLVLNMGIYDGLSKNYLALNDWKNYTLYHNKYLELQAETKQLKRKSINQSILSLAEIKTKEIEQLQSFFKPIQIVLAVLFIAIIFFLIRFIRSSEKKLKILKKQFKSK